MSQRWRYSERIRNQRQPPLTGSGRVILHGPRQNNGIDVAVSHMRVMPQGMADHRSEPPSRDVRATSTEHGGKHEFLSIR